MLLIFTGFVNVSIKEWRLIVRYDYDPFGVEVVHSCGNIKLAIDIKKEKDHA